MPYVAGLAGVYRGGLMEGAAAYLWVALGGAIGATARFAVVQLAVARWGATFPWGTLVVNVVGSLAIGFLAAVLSARTTDPALRFFLITGVLGGYTTFSAFSLETLALLYEQRWGAATSYMGGSVVLSLAATAVGYAAAVRFSQ
jgi:fluoride exporter